MNTVVLYIKAFKLLLSVGRDAHLAISMYKLLDRLPQAEIAASYFSPFRKGYPSQSFQL